MHHLGTFFNTASRTPGEARELIFALNQLKKSSEGLQRGSLSRDNALTPSPSLPDGCKGGGSSPGFARSLPAPATAAGIPKLREFQSPRNSKAAGIPMPAPGREGQRLHRQWMRGKQSRAKRVVSQVSSSARAIPKNDPFPSFPAASRCCPWE